MSEVATNNNQVAVIENSIEVLKTGPQILANNQQRQQKALAVGRNILAAIQEKGMDAELDEKAKVYLIKVNDAVKEMKEQRAAVTQIMDELKKMYTVVENELDAKKPGTIPAQVQAARDAYAKQLAEEAERKRREAEREAAKKVEAVNIKTEMTTKYLGQYNEHLLKKKQGLVSAFNAITLDNYEEKAKALKELSFSFQFQHEGLYAVNVKYHTTEELKAISDAVILENREEIEANFHAEMNLLKDELIEKLPSKLEELREQRRLEIEAAEAKRKAEEEEAKRRAEIEKANEAERKRLEQEAAAARAAEEKRQAELKAEQERLAAERKKREEEEAARLAQEAAEAQRKAEEQAMIKKQGEETMVLFEKEAAIAETVQAPEARQGYEITVLHPVGYTQIFALWFEKVGKDLPVDKLGNTKLDQMKTWAEKEAHKSGTKIDSKFLQYKETFKAVNRKSK